MKRLLVYVLLSIILLNCIPLVGSAAERIIETIYFEDGCYMTVEIISCDARVSGSKTASKQYIFYDESDNAQWKAVLTGSFTYTGSSATCTSSNISTTIYDSYWYVVSKSASKSGSKATGSVVMGYNYDGVTISRVPANLTLSCDADGNLS